MTKVKTTATGPKPLPKTHHERQLSSGEVGVQLILLNTCYSSTTTINGVEQRYINTSTAQSTGTSSTKILCPQQLTIADLKLWINEELAQGNREKINWNEYSIYIIKEEMLSVKTLLQEQAMHSIHSEAVRITNTDTCFIPSYAA